MDLIKYDDYDYKNLGITLHLTYLLYVKIWCLLEFNVRNYESFSNRMLQNNIHAMKLEYVNDA